MGELKRTASAEFTKHGIPCGRFRKKNNEKYVLNKLYIWAKTLAAYATEATQASATPGVRSPSSCRELAEKIRSRSPEGDRPYLVLIVYILTRTSSVLKGAGTLL